jgi:subtilase family serine protease
MRVRRLKLGTTIVGLAFLATTAVGTAAPALARVIATPQAVRLSPRHYSQPPTTKDCKKQIGIKCYAPFQLQRAYDLNSLYSGGWDGTGKTIAIVDSFGSPTAAADLATFDSDFGLPAPPHFDVIQPAGPVPPFDPNDPTQVGWAFETSLDVQWAHAIAPGANILLVETPTAETEGVVGFPDIVKAENYVINHHLADVITQSFAATERTFTAESLNPLRSAYINAANNHVTVLAASGDQGPTGPKPAGNDLYPFRTTQWPASDPLVTAVGGTQLKLDKDGNRVQPDRTWNDTLLFGGAAATGSGRSIFFSRPDYQDSVESVVAARRGVPDISMSAAVDGGVLTYVGFLTGSDNGYYIIGGTSESSPEFAGVVAIADQAAGHDLGLLNPLLYALGSGSAGIPDITIGNNTVFFQDKNGNTVTIHGYPAQSGYDLANGLGTVDAASLVPALASAAR